MDITDFDDDDPIARLIVHYFYPCQQLLKDYDRARLAKTRAGNRTRQMDRQELIYLRLWLASLFAVVEGFQAIKLKDATIDGMSTQHWESLRLLRNGTFHFQPVHRKQSQFFTGDVSRIDWARQLHLALEEYFSEYRINMIVAKITC